MGIRDRIASVSRLASTFLDNLADTVTKAEDYPEIGNETDEQQGAHPTPQVPTQAAESDPKSLFWDPFAIVEMLGYKERPTPITHQTLNQMYWRLPIVQAIVQTRTNQVAAFAQPQRDRFMTGFRVKLRDSELRPKGADKKFAKDIEQIIMRTGVTNNPRGRDDFATFLRKVVWDSMVYDAATFEIVPNRKGQPAEWYAVDATTIRLADTTKTFFDEDDEEEVRYVQLLDNVIVTQYNAKELAYCIRNPRSSIRAQGYGTPELEQLTKVITAMLYSFEYNVKSFTQGAMQKGLLNFKGAIPDKQLRAFRRQWYQLVSGVENSFRTPIVNADDVQWIPMHTSNREMEYAQWMDFLIKCTCAVYQLDPIEINFKYGNSGQKSMFEAANQQKLTESKDRGLKPLLRFIAGAINKYILWPIDENFEFVFLGLDAQTPEELAKINEARVKTIYMVDELRAENDLPPLPEGKGQVILDPTWMQYQQAKMMQENTPITAPTKLPAAPAATKPVLDLKEENGKPGKPSTALSPKPDKPSESLYAKSESATLIIDIDI